MLPLRSAFAIPLGPTVAALAIEAFSAVAQGVLAISLGTLARFLGSAGKGAPEAAGMTWMSRLWSNLPPGVSLTSATSVAFVGLLAVTIGGGARILLETRETRSAADLAARARRRILASALVSHVGRSIGVAVTTPLEIEQGARAEHARLRAFVHLLVLAAVVAVLDARLAIVVVLILAPFAWLLRPIRRAIRASHLAATRGAIETIDASRDLLEHAPLWATCGGASLVMSRIDALSRDTTALASRAARARATASTSNELLAALAIVVLVAVFAPGALFPRPALLPVLITLVSAYRPIRDLAEASALVERGTRAAESIPELRASPDAIRTWPRGVLTARALVLDVGCELAREGFDFELRPGEILAVVGAPGTGKSALLETIAGVRATSGSLTLGGARFDAAPIGSRPVAWVPPSPPVLPGTLAENLSPSGDPSLAIRARAILDALGPIPAAAGERLGVRGRAVSSGEAQRIALARALASDAPILLLDEPTANLDVDGELRAMEVLRRELGDRCAILVTHRPAPLSLADRVIDLGKWGERAAESERRIA